LQFSVKDLMLTQVEDSTMHVELHQLDNIVAKLKNFVKSMRKEEPANEEEKGKQSKKGDGSKPDEKAKVKETKRKKKGKDGTLTEGGKKEKSFDDKAGAPKKNEKNPLDLLPPSVMNLDNTKRSFFLQKPFNPDFFTEFWSSFDKEGFCIFKSTYKFDIENTVYFITLGLLNGFIQRAHFVREYAFGVVNLYSANEDTPPFKINGAWVFRGWDLPKEMKECSDSDGYEWTRLDVTNPGHRKLFEELFTASAFGTDEVLDRKFLR